MTLAGRSDNTTLVATAVLAIGSLVVLFGLFRSPAQAFGGLLVAGWFGVSVSLGAAIMIAVHVLGGAYRWNPIRRLPMALASLLPLPAALIAFVMFAGRTAVYPWADPEVVAHSEILQDKAVWFDTPFILARLVVVLLIWIALVRSMRARLNEHIAHDTEATRKRLARTCGLFVVLLAPTISIGAWDWAMSLEPEWFSTMYGVYAFSGALLAALATVALFARNDAADLAPLRQRAGIRHDIGKLLFAFSAFWAYIWFSQYMLIWYANLPEETTYFAARLTGPWAALFWLNPVLNFVVPFVVLMPASTKMNPRILQHVGLVVLLGRWLDAYLMIMPPLAPEGGFPVAALAATVALVLAAVLLFGHAGRTVPAAVAVGARQPEAATEA